MRVLQVGKYDPRYAPGGIEKVCELVEDALRESGVEVTSVYHSRFWANINKTGRIPILKSQPLSVSLGLNVILSQRKYDYVLLHHPNVFLLLLFSLLFPRKLIVFCHAVAQQISRFPLLRIIEQALLKRAGKIICTSDAARNYFGGNAHIVPLCLSRQAEKMLRRPRNLPQKYDVLFVGRFVEYKGIDSLLRALTLIQKPLRVAFVGGGVLEGQITNFAASSPHEVQVMRNVTDEAKVEILHSSRMLILPSISSSEAFGIVLIEAACAGVPAITTTLPFSATSFVVSDKETGVIVKPKDAQALKAAILSLMEMPQEEYETLSVRATERYQAFFSYDIFKRNLQAVFAS